MIGNNNMFFTAETGIEAAAKGVKACVDNVRAKFPKAEIVVAKILPVKLESDPKIHVLDL